MSNKSADNVSRHRLDSNYRGIDGNKKMVLGTEYCYKTSQGHVPVKMSCKNSDKKAIAYFMFTTGSSVTYISYETLTGIFGYTENDLDKSNPITTNQSYLMPLDKYYNMYPIVIPELQVGCHIFTNQVIYTSLENQHDYANILGMDIITECGGFGMYQAEFKRDSNFMKTPELIKDGYISL